MWKERNGCELGLKCGFEIGWRWARVGCRLEEVKWALLGIDITKGFGGLRFK
jgi:hypothetical protein